MKKISFYALLGMMALALAGCNDKNEPQVEPQPEDKPQEQQEVIPSAFPKKHLIEEFTGQDCGYCPGGMGSVHEFIENDSSFILVLHHDGYTPDHFTVAGSTTITKELKVSGAPSITINRSKIKYGTKSAIVFHPGYLPETKKSQLADSTYASVVIANTYDAASRQLKVKVSGALCKEDYPPLNLTVLVKESGMIDYQADYYDTFEGWEEFRHTNAVRAFLTGAKGDAIEVDSTRHYTAEYTFTMDQNWDANNCMVVAFLSETFKPVVQVEQAPVVSGTKGGDDIQYGGITPVPVADYYPEPSATEGPADFSGNRAETLTTAYAFYQQYPEYGLTLWAVQAYDPSASINVDGTPSVPFLMISLLTEYNATPQFPASGTFALNLTEQSGSAIAGYRTDTPPSVGGAMFYFTSLAYLQEGYLYPMAQWLVVDGEMSITSEGWSLNGHALNGTEIHLVGTTPIQNGGAARAPMRMRARAPYLL